MFKREKTFILILSALVVVIFNLITGIFGANVLYLIAIPLYLFALKYIHIKSESKEQIEFAVANCLEESDFNVLDRVEQLRVYFCDTTDVISYLSKVDSRVLAYVFDERNIELSNKDYITGAVNCLNIFKGYKGYCHFHIDMITTSNLERVTTILSILYMVSKQIDKDSNTIYITYKKNGDKISIDVSDQYQNRIEEDVFCKKLLHIFSSDQFTFHQAV